MGKFGWGSLRIKKVLALVVSMAAVMLFSGCTTFPYGDNLLSLPSLPEEYINLQDEINKVLATGATLTAAESGSNRPSIQMIDLDGDAESEALAFFRRPDGTFLIKAYRQQENKYLELGSATAVGLSLHSIYYPICSPTGERCVAVCWGIDESGNYGMDVYALTEGGMENVLNVQYSGVFVGDFYGDSLDELCFATRDPLNGQMSLQVYSVGGAGYALDSEVFLCEDASAVARIILGNLDNGEHALFLDSNAYGGGYVTDIIAYSREDDRLRNVTRGLPGGGVTSWRSGEVYCQDIDGDGIIEVPSAASMMSSIYPDERNKLFWTQYGDSPVRKVCTYHMVSEKWYLRWFDNWDDTVVTQSTRYSRMVKTVFFRMPGDMTIGSMPQPDEGNTILTIYVISGDNSQAYLSVYGATEISRRDGLIYAYVLGDPGYPEYNVDGQEVRDHFAEIENEWTSEVDG